MKVIIIGAGGHSRVVADAISAGSPDVTIVGHLDDDARKLGTQILGRSVLGPLDSVRRWPHDAVALAIGDNRVRSEVYDLLVSTERILHVVHPRATVAGGVAIGDGTVVFAGAVVNPGAQLLANTIVSTGATVDHDSVLEAHAHVGPGCHVNGGCFVGRGALLTTSVVVGRGVRIGSWTVVGAGAVVLSDLPAGVLAYGVPARVIRPL